MHRNFTLFQSHLDLAQSYWADLLQRGDWAIDATCGSGHDTLKLAQLVREEGGVIGIDLQEEAIAKTRGLLEGSLPFDALSRIHLYTQSHCHFPQVAAEKPIKLIVYNLGYLPGGDKQLTTMAQTTLESVSKALNLLQPGGACSITCYPGHAEGAVEERALLEMAATLPPSLWNVCYHAFPNRQRSPSLILIQKNSLQP